MRIRRGSWDSYEIRSRSSVRLWTSLEAAQYHFVPEVSVGELTDPAWRLAGTILDEGYTPEEGPFFPIPAQVARFRDGDSLRIALAGTLADSPLRRVPRVTAHFIVTDAPESFPLRAQAEFRRETPRFLERAAMGPGLVGLEVFSDIGIGWYRKAIVPLALGRPEVSDLLLFDPAEEMEPDALPQAASAMLGSVSVPQNMEMGVFWEVYGIPREVVARFDLTLERVTGGLVDRLVGLLPGGREEGRGRVEWTETLSPGTHSRGIVLQLTALDPGQYTLVLGVGWEGQPPLERRRRITVE
jgi:hypothetical protein